MTAAGLTAADLPSVLTPDTVLRRVTPGGLAEILGLSYHVATGTSHRLGAAKPDT